jgi:hypothetical protein
VGRAAPVLQALVGDVVIESRQVEGRKRPEMVAKFPIAGIPGRKTQAAGCVTAVGACGARRSVRRRPPDRDIARIEAALSRGLW